MPAERCPEPCPEPRRRVVEGLAKRYFAELYRLLEKAERSQMDRIVQAGKVIANAIVQGGTLYIFGTGHSHMGFVPSILVSSNVDR